MQFSRARRASDGSASAVAEATSAAARFPTSRHHDGPPRQQAQVSLLTDLPSRGFSRGLGSRARRLARARRKSADDRAPSASGGAATRVSGRAASVAGSEAKRFLAALGMTMVVLPPRERRSRDVSVRCTETSIPPDAAGEVDRILGEHDPVRAWQEAGGDAWLASRFGRCFPPPGGAWCRPRRGKFISRDRCHVGRLTQGLQISGT